MLDQSNKDACNRPFCTDCQIHHDGMHEPIAEGWCYKHDTVHAPLPTTAKPYQTVKG